MKKVRSEGPRQPKPDAEPAPPVEVEPVRLEELFLRALPSFLPGFEVRPGQLDLSRSILEVMNFGGRGLFEAGTGTGKSLAYLLPAALWSKANQVPVIISTYTRTLQAQLWAEELPLVAKLTGVRVALVKGRSNYICRRKLELAANDPEYGAEFARIQEWVRQQGSGEREDLPVALDDSAWERIESDSEQTRSKNCPHYEQCFYYRARRQSQEAGLIVANHALLLLDLSLKSQGFPGILPKTSRVILDEAHHIEAATTSANETRISERALTRLLNPLVGKNSALTPSHWNTQQAALVNDAFAQTADLVGFARAGFAQLALTTQDQGALLIENTPPEAPFWEELANKAHTCARTLGKLEPDRSHDQPSHIQAQLDVSRAKKRLDELSNQIRAFLKPTPGLCRYLERGRTGVVAASSPIEPGPIFQQRTDLLEGVVLTSATLAIAGSLETTASRLGLPGCTTGIYPSPFNYREQSILAIPKDLPGPDSPDFLDAAAQMIARSVEICGGGAFVLCTAYGFMRDLASRVEALTEGNFQIFVQGKSQRAQILQQFREHPRAILFGADSFWEGVSIKGDALRLVLIPKLPFRVPTEPVARARYEKIKAEGGDPFKTLSLPEAVLRLRQGFGRLIRTRADRGVVMILDRRILEASYGPVFLQSLPEARKVLGSSQAIYGQLQNFYRGYHGGSRK